MHPLPHKPVMTDDTNILKPTNTLTDTKWFQADLTNFETSIKLIYNSLAKDLVFYFINYLFSFRNAFHVWLVMCNESNFNDHFTFNCLHTYIPR